MTRHMGERLGLLNRELTLEVLVDNQVPQCVVFACLLVSNRLLSAWNPFLLSSREPVTFLIFRVFCISNQLNFKPQTKLSS
jgi:hypothetical protein